MAWMNRRLGLLLPILIPLLSHFPFSFLQLISELPTSIQLNITNVTAKAYLKKVKALDSLPDYFISTLSIELQVSPPPVFYLLTSHFQQTETFLPGDEIVAAGSIAQGLYIGLSALSLHPPPPPSSLFTPSSQQRCCHEANL
jgi:hypothetical protein